MTYEKDQGEMKRCRRIFSLQLARKRRNTLRVPDQFMTMESCLMNLAIADLMGKPESFWYTSR